MNSKKRSPDSYLLSFLVYSISVFLLVLGLTYSFVRYFNPTGFLGYRRAAIFEYKHTLKKQSNDLVFVGDSSLRRGVIPSVLKDYTGIRSVNLGTVASSSLEGYRLIINRYLERNSKPQMIVLYINQLNLFINVNKISATKTYEYIKYGKIDDIIYLYSKYSHDLAIFAPIRLFLDDMLGRVLSSIRYNYNSKSMFKRLKSNDGYDRVNGSGLSRNKVYNEVKKYNLTEKEVQKDELREFIQYYKKNYNIPVLVYMAPIPDGMQQKDYFSKKLNPEIDNKVYFLPNQYFIDHTHLNHTGALYNTKIVSEWLQKYSGTK